MLTSTYFAFSEWAPQLKWAPLLKGRKLNESPRAHLDNYSNQSFLTLFDTEVSVFLIMIAPECVE